jgi:8-oxo-dGTP pyrophosphatase MutT (NUDIX family)
MRRIQSFEVSLKAFIRRGDHVLLLREADTGFWELPGGRIDAGEEWEPHEGVLAREIAEELGPAFRVHVTGQATSWTRQRPEDSVFQFLMVRVCRHLAGEVALSREHDRFAWLDRSSALALGFPPRSGYREGLERLWAMQV